MQQALRVRPYDVDVLYSVGKTQLIAQQKDDALRTWRPTFQTAGKHQRDIIRILSHDLTAAEFLEEFQPDWSSLDCLWRNYGEFGTTDDMQAILPYALRMAELQTPHATAGKAAMIWLGLSHMQLEMSDPQAALHSLQQAYAISPENFAVRYACGKLLFELEQYEAAEPHLRWCLSRVPDNVGIQALLKQSSRVKMQRLARSSQGQTHL